MFTSDFSKVLNILKGPTIGTDDETWIKGLKYGRNSMQDIQAHYDGAPEGAHYTQISTADLKKTFYKNETTLTLEKYATKLMGIFNVIEKYWVQLYGEQNVGHILDHTTSQNTELNIELKICKSSHSSTLSKVCTQLYTVIVRL